MNRRYCYGTDCDEDRCRCHEDEIKNEVEQELNLKTNKKNMATKIIGIIEILVGGFFLLNIASDVQMGFGLVILFQGVNLLLNK